jgi:hypothetical protein
VAGGTIALPALFGTFWSEQALILLQSVSDDLGLGK